MIGDTNAKYWYHTDHLGSVKAVTNNLGVPVWKAEYLPFGQQIDKNKLDPTFEEDDLGFTGKGYDAEIGLYYFNARWYDADTGRFISEDPVADPNNPNLYTYCRNNPLRFTDPTGLIGEDGYPGSNPINWPGGNNNQDGSYTGGSGGPTGPPSSGGNNVPQSGPSTPEGPGGGVSGDNNQTKTTYYRNGNPKSQTVYNPDGTKQSETRYNKDGTIKSIKTYTYNGDKNRTEYTYKYNDYGVTFIQKEQKQNFFGGWVTQSASGYTEVTVSESGFTFKYREEFKTYIDKNGVLQYEYTTNWEINIADTDAGQLFAERMNRARNKSEGLLGYLAEKLTDSINYVDEILAGVDIIFDNGDDFFMRGDSFSFKEVSTSIGGFPNYLTSWNHMRLRDDGSYRVIDSGTMPDGDPLTNGWLYSIFKSHITF